MTSLSIFLVYLCIIALLAALSYYDNKEYILPDRLNLALAIACLALHAVSGWTILSPLGCLIGAAAGGGFLLAVYFLANKFYDAEAVGLGDVKLMAAAGLGLGVPDVMMALTVGAGLGLLHGLYLGFRQRRSGAAVNFARVNVPAGVGFCAGIALVMGWRLMEQGIFG